MQCALRFLSNVAALRRSEDLALSEAEGISRAERPARVGKSEFQLLSLLARFQEISSPIVELVLETGCL